MTETAAAGSAFPETEGMTVCPAMYSEVHVMLHVRSIIRNFRAVCCLAERVVIQFYSLYQFL